MKRWLTKPATLFLLLTGMGTVVRAQWTTGTDIYNTNTGNVGIGTTTPVEKLTVAGNVKLSGGLYWDWPNRIIEVVSNADSISKLLRFRNSMGSGQGNPNGGFDFADHLGNSVLRINNANVGVGVTSPTEKLAVAGNIKLSGSIYWDWANRTIEVVSNADSVSKLLRFRNSMGSGQGNPNGGFDFADYLGNSVLRINNNAVGIGTTTTGSFKLAVEGKIGAREIRVTSTSPWPDYVFARHYELPSLANLEQYIKENKHLPNIPSAQEVKDKGIELGDMNARLLEKIEELTLYIIELNKKIEELKKEQQQSNH